MGTVRAALRVSPSEAPVLVGRAPTTSLNPNYLLTGSLSKYSEIGPQHMSGVDVQLTATQEQPQSSLTPTP